jgi:predicted extracellular nuclease
MKSNTVHLRAILTPLVLGLLISLSLGSTVSVLASPDPSAPEILLTEIVVTPTSGEFVEIYNPTGSAIDLTNVYITDAIFSPGSDFYYNIVTGADAGGGGFGDFHARFPSGAAIPSGSYQTIAIAGSDDFFDEYGINPDYELYEDGAVADSIPDMLEALPGSINDQGGLTNGGEVVILYFWDGATDLVTDLDYALWGDKDEAVDKTGVSTDGPDGDTDTSAYLNDTSIASQDVVATGAHGSGNSWQRDDLAEGSEIASGGNGVGGDDETSEDASNTWCEASPTPGSSSNCGPPPPPPSTPATIMEIQGSDQFSSFVGDFVETTGVVTLYTANDSNFWMQDPIGDGDPNTSDGIFVSGGAFPVVGTAPEIGDMIRIIAQVEEQQFGNALPLTRLNSVHTVEVTSSGNPLPASISLVDLPDESIAEGIIFWESLEGMLVGITDAKVVAPTGRFGEFAMITEVDSEPGSGYFPQTKQILLWDLGGNLVDYNPEKILVDDGSLDDPIIVMPGDKIRSLVGVVDYTFGNYKLQPSTFEVKTHNLPKLPVSTRSGPEGDTVITTFNVENLFDLETAPRVVFDAIGQVGTDPGSQWGTGDTSTQNNTIRRQSTVCRGDTDDSDAFDPTVEWDGFAQNTFDGLGSHAPGCDPAIGIFFSEYIEGSSNNKALEIYNGTDFPVDLSAEGIKVMIFFNGNTSPGKTINLAGTIAVGDVFVLAHSSAVSDITDVADQVSGGGWFNGNDAVLLVTSKDDASSTPTAEELEIQLTKLALAIELELGLPEILVVEEIENTAILQELGDRVNLSAGTNYMAISFETSDGRGIEPGFLWDSDRVALMNAFQLDDSIVSGVAAAFGPSSPSPGREPLVGIFMIDGKEVTIVANHFKSKGGDDPPFGVAFNRITEVQRKAQAQVVRDYVEILLGDDPDGLVMVTGDLNDFQFGEPGEGPDHPIAILEGVGGGVHLENLIELEKGAERYTFVFDGNSQVLDHMLISPALLDLYVGVDILHFNSSFPSDLHDDPSTPLRASDHDAVEGRFVFED